MAATASRWLQREPTLNTAVTTNTTVEFDPDQQLYLWTDSRGNSGTAKTFEDARFHEILPDLERAVAARYAGTEAFILNEAIADGVLAVYQTMKQWPAAARQRTQWHRNRAKTYAGHTIDSRLNRKLEGETTVISALSTSQAEQAIGDDIADHVVDQVTIADFLRSLTDEQQIVIAGKLAGDTDTTISDRVGALRGKPTSPRAVRQILIGLRTHPGVRELASLYGYASG